MTEKIEMPDSEPRARYKPRRLNRDWLIVTKEPFKLPDPAYRVVDMDIASDDTLTITMVPDYKRDAYILRQTLINLFAGNRKFHHLPRERLVKSRKRGLKMNEMLELVDIARMDLINETQGWKK